MNCPIDSTDTCRVVDWSQAVIMPVTRLHPHVVQTYWQTLYMHDLLRFRLCDVENPTWTDAQNLICKMGQHMYYVAHEAFGPQIIAEFTLTDFYSRTAQAHFSFHPTSLRSAEKVLLGHTLCRTVLEHWERAPKEPFLDTLLGTIPVKNRPARWYVRKVGFKKLGIIPSAHFFDGKVADAALYYMTTLRKEN